MNERRRAMRRRTLALAATCLFAAVSSSLHAPLEVGASSTSLRVVQRSTAATTYWVYAKGRFMWPGDYSYSAVPDYDDHTGAAPGGFADIRVDITGKWGGWQPYAPHWRFNSARYRALTFELKPTRPDQSWSCQFIKIGDIPVGISVNVVHFGPHPVVGRWARYTIPLADLGVAGTTVYKFAIQDQTGREDNAWFVDNVGFVR